MPKTPHTKGPDETLSLLADPYRFISRQCQRLGANAFESRFLLKKTNCLKGAKAAEIFYDTTRFEREGAMPVAIQKTLLGQGGVQGLDGETHRHRKQMFMGLMTPERVRALAQLFEAEWRRAVPGWTRKGEIVFYDELHEPLTRAVCAWAGVPLPDDEAGNRAGELRALFDRAWPLLDPEALLRGLLSTPELLRRCAPWLAAADVDVLVARGAPPAWTDVDLPLLDAARRGVGDPRSEVRERRARRAAAEERRVMSDVVSDLIAADDGDLRIMSMLRGQDLRGTLAQPTASERDPYAGPFAHLVIDEAQELTDAQWRMLLRRCPSRSVTIVGDRAQARHGFPETWGERLARVGLDRANVTSLSVNYRTPQVVMDVAGPVIRMTSEAMDRLLPQLREGAAAIADVSQDLPIFAEAVS